MLHRFTSYFKKKCTLFEFFCIILILVIGFTVRIYHLTSVPYGFHADEAAFGYNAYTILTKGTDEYGTPYPAFFKTFGEYKSPVQVYSTVPLIALFGLNEFSTRLTSVIYGMLALLAIYFVTRELFEKEKHAKYISLFALLFLAISPWAVQFSRVAYEMMPFVFFTTFGLFLFLKAQKKPLILPIAIVTFALALYSYYAGRIFIPLFGIGLFIIYFRFFLTHKKMTLISTLLLVIVLIPFVQSLISQQGFARWKQTDIFDHPPQHVSVFRQIELNYLNHFSPNFLFIGGNNALPGNQILRDGVNGIGELYLFQLPLVLFGVYMLFKMKNQNKKAFLTILLWFILYPTGGIFAADGSPFARRSIIGVIPFQILSALGSVWLLQVFLKAKKVYLIGISGIAGVIMLLSFVYYLQLYFIAYPKYSSAWWGWQYGPKDITAYFVKHESQYDDLVMAPYFNGRYEFFKFYAPNDCTKCKVGLPEDYYNTERKQLYALPPGYISSHPNFTYTLRKILYYPDGTQAYLITELHNK